MDTTRIINIIGQGKFTEQSPEKPVRIDESRIPYPRDRRGRITIDRENTVLQETGGELTTANFPDALRMGIQFDAWTSYNETPITYPQFVRMTTSNKQQEEYLKDSPIGKLPVVAENQPYPRATTDFDSGVIIRNYKRGMIVEVSEEMRRFDQVGKVRELAELLGRSARRTEEQDVMNVITTTANYTRTNTAGDNDETVSGSGANQQAVTFSPSGLITAFNILRTMKDRKTGVYLNVLPDTLIVTPKLWWAAQQLISSPTLWGQGDADATVVYGQGTNNSFFNVVRKIIVSPEFGNSFGWWLGESGRAVTFQRVDPIQILIGNSDQTSAAYMDHDGIPYRVRNWYGVGPRDDRYMFLSTSTTAPTIN